MMKKVFIPFLLGILMVFPAFSQQLLTLEKCRELALKNNIQAKNAQISVNMAQEQQKEAFTNFFPSVSATGAGVVMEKPLLTQTVETGYPAPNDKATVDMIKNNLIGGVMATQPIFAGGQIVNGNRLAKAGLEVSKMQQQMTEDEILLTTERYFWQIVSLKEKLKTIKSVETMLDRIHSDVSVSVQAGLTTRNDLLRIELEQNKPASGKLKLENGLSIFKMALAQHLGLTDTNFEIETPDMETLLSPLPLTDTTDNVKNRIEYKLLEKSVDVARLQKDMEVGKHMPTLAVGAGYNWVKMDLGMQTEQKKNFGVAFATLSVPISDWWGGSHAIKRKKLELQKTENTQQEKTELLRIQMKQTDNELQEAYKQVLIARKSISVAQENLRISQNNFDAGITILSDLLDAQNLLQQSRDQYSEASTAYLIKLAEWKQINKKEL